MNERVKVLKRQMLGPGNLKDTAGRRFTGEDRNITVIPNRMHIFMCACIKFMNAYIII